MKTQILATVSAIAILASGPALAENNAKTKANVDASAESNTTNSLQQDAKEAWQNIKEDTAEAYENVKATFIGEESGSATRSVVIDSRHTATGMIGKAVYNGRQERIGTVEDIIVSADGNANMIVIADGEFPGFEGKLVAFDYSIISRQDANGDVIAPLSEENLDRAAEFSYEAADAGDNVRVIPNNGYSVARLLDGQLVNPQGESVAEIDNISFKNGQASELIVGFDKILGLGGKNAALDYKAAQLVRNGDELDFRLSTNHAAQFEVYKETAAN